MKKETFDELMTSIEQGGLILKGKKAPSRKFMVEDLDALTIRRHLELLDAERL